MTLLEFFARILEFVAWPITLLLILVLFHKPIVGIFSRIEKLKYGDLEATFRRVSEEALKKIAPNKDEIKKISTPQASSFNDPRAAVLQAWRQITNAAEQKLNELIPNRNERWFGPDESLNYLSTTGALVPTTTSAISQLQILKDQVAYYPDEAISMESAKIYIAAADAAVKQIQALISLPEINLIKLTALILEYNHLIDTRNYNHITIQQIHDEIEKGTVLDFIEEVAKNDINLTWRLDADKGQSFEKEYTKHLRSLYECYAGQERRKWGIENLGLCLLIAWTNEIIQQGSGWYPNDNIA